MTVGNRLNNNKRNFLFISKVLGKHIEVEPNICRGIGYLLASLMYGENDRTKNIISFINAPHIKGNFSLTDFETYYETSEKICVLGFAETATGLGMAVASAIKNSYYLNTTREPITQTKSFINFEEEHSHATSHLCFPSNESHIIDADRLILVDDELTTGKSLLNMINELIKVTNVKKFSALTILDWRNSEQKQHVLEFCQEHGVEIEVMALISGDVKVMDHTVYTDEQNDCITKSLQNILKLNKMSRISVQTQHGMTPYYQKSGRFGISHEEIILLERQCEQMAKLIMKSLKDAPKLLVLGHGEDIYIPSRVAAYLQGDVSYKSTTRSPIHCEERKNYPINQKHTFKDEGVCYYFYNKDRIEKEYDHVILITEKELDIQLTKNMMIVHL